MLAFCFCGDYRAELYIEFLDRESFLKLIYGALVRPHLKLCNSVWSPHLKRQSADVWPVLATRCNKIVAVLGNMIMLRDCVPFDCLLYFFKIKKSAIAFFTSLKSRRVRGDVIQVYKISNHIDDVDCFTFFKTLIKLEILLMKLLLNTAALVTLENIHLVTELHPTGNHLLIM